MKKTKDELEILASRLSDGAEAMFEAAALLASQVEEPFMWVKHRPPTKMDADKNGQVSHYFDSNASNVGVSNSYEWSVKAGMPWARTKDTAHFTADNPAPSPFDQ